MAPWIRRPSEASIANLRVKPFLHQGVTASIREFLVGAFHAEMGLQAADPVLCAATKAESHESGETGREHRGLQVRPGARRFRAAAGLRRGRGRTRTATARSTRSMPALVDYVEFYLLNYFKPGQYRVTPRATAGSCADAAHRLHELPRAEPHGPQRSPHRRRGDEVTTPSAASSTTCSRRRRRCSRRSPIRPRIRSCSRSAGRSSSATCSRT